MSKLEELKDLNKQLYKKYGTEIEKLGYSMAHGISYESAYDKKSKTPKKVCFMVMLQPKPGKPDEISDVVLDEIKNKILPKEWHGYKVFVNYVGRIVPQS
ncbi:hypothetical protein COV11_02755 [Candidatus Woesearchaeota archaeon CG10_big_fil_rev_8_21_14_0_10_30_7]|nr:MAG: hypothetical protein COV11_02755 [Candidatus Woesearchaeota archaeon CG10_big_fil_rev_8_21_14_0_10_30_7]